MVIQKYRRIVLALLVCASVLLFSVILSHCFFLLTDEIMIPNSTIIKVERGSSLSRLVQQLHEKEVVSNPDSLSLILRMMGLEKKIKAGVYQIKTDDNLWRLIGRIISGKTKSFSFTIVEGTTFTQILEKLKTTKYVNSQAVDTLPNKK